MDKLEMQTPNFTDENIEKLAGLFPNCVTEAKDAEGKLKKAIDVDLLNLNLIQVEVSYDWLQSYHEYKNSDTHHKNST